MCGTDTQGWGSDPDAADFDGDGEGWMWCFADNSPGATQVSDVSVGWQQPSEFEVLAMPLFDSLYNFARWIASDRADAEDLVQETYLKALRSFHSCRPHTSFRAWMFAILKNTSSSKYAKLRKTVILAFDPEDEVTMPESAVTPESVLLDRSAAENLWKAIERLPLPYREVLLLREIEEASYSEIAEILSIPVGTVMSRLSRARSAIRESLRDAPKAPCTKNPFQDREACAVGRPCQ